MHWGELPSELTLEAFRLLVAEPDSENADGADRESLAHESATKFAKLASEAQRHWLIGAWEGGKVLGCWLLSQAGPGTFLVGDPGTSLSLAGNDEACDRLVTCLDDWTAAQQASMVQVMLSDQAAEAWEPRLNRQGFPRATRLYYLEAHPSEQPILANENREWSWIASSQLSPESLEHLVAQTHIDSQDCPFLEGRRDPKQMLAGYASGTESGTELWEVLCVRGEPAACLLAGLQSNGSQIEWVYVGVASNFRRQGLGRELIRHGFERARERSIDSIVLGIDEGNLPAIRLYASSGFRSWARRVILIKWQAAPHA